MHSLPSNLGSLWSWWAIRICDVFEWNLAGGIHDEQSTLLALPRRREPSSLFLISPRLSDALTLFFQHMHSQMTHFIFHSEEWFCETRCQLWPYRPRCVMQLYSTLRQLISQQIHLKPDRNISQLPWCHTLAAHYAALSIWCCCSLVLNTNLVYMFCYIQYNILALRVNFMTTCKMSKPCGEWHKSYSKYTFVLTSTVSIQLRSIKIWPATTTIWFISKFGGFRVLSWNTAVNNFQKKFLVFQVLVALMHELEATRLFGIFN